MRNKYTVLLDGLATDHVMSAVVATRRVCLYIRSMLRNVARLPLSAADVKTMQSTVRRARSKAFQSVHPSECCYMCRCM